MQCSDGRSNHYSSKLENLKTRPDGHLPSPHKNNSIRQYVGINYHGLRSVATSWQARTCKSINFSRHRKNPTKPAFAHLTFFRQVKEILTSLARNVHANEKGCVKYLVLEQKNSDGEQADMVLIEESVKPPMTFASSADPLHGWENVADFSFSRQVAFSGSSRQSPQAALFEGDT